MSVTQDVPMDDADEEFDFENEMKTKMDSLSSRGEWHVEKPVICN